MKLRVLTLLAFLLAAGPLHAPAAETAKIPPVTLEFARVPDSLGVNIHFTDARPGELEMLAAAGFKWVRMDFAWGGTERVKNQYNFGAYDRLLAALEPHGIRAIFILDYSNRLYDGGLSPQSDAGRAAFARWAAAAATHFKGHGILWEMYNEPNIQFWKPKPDVNQYIPLALAVGKALREAAPGEQYCGPATSLIDFKFLEPCFKAGLLEYWSAVTVHPYRETGPETAIPEYAKLRAMIDQYAPKGKSIPIISGEWGYSVLRKRTPEIQGKYLPRQFLVNLMSGVPISIWYDWHDDGTDPKENEHNFGTVRNQYFAGRSPVYDTKPSYEAARTLSLALRGFKFDRRIDMGAPDVYVLVFKKGAEQRIVAWITAAGQMGVTLPGLTGTWRVTGHLGEKKPPVTAVPAGPPGRSGPAGLFVTLTDAPQYLIKE